VYVQTRAWVPSLLGLACCCWWEDASPGGGGEGDYFQYGTPHSGGRKGKKREFISVKRKEKVYKEEERKN